MSITAEAPRVWLVTGSSAGFGRSMVEFALEKGDLVVATLRSPAMLDDLRGEYSSERLLIIPLDVAKSEDIPRAFQEAKHAFGRVDVVFNNAGISLNGEVEGTPEGAARNLFDVNFWGAANVNTEAVRFFRDENPAGSGGRIVVNSSYAGLSPITCAGYYSAAKFALEGLTQTLATEIDARWNIKITLIEPGFFRTNANRKGARLPLHPAYSNPDSVAVQTRRFIELVTEPTRGKAASGDTAKAAKKVYELSLLPNPPMRLVLGQDALQYARKQVRMVTDDFAAYESWSEDLLED